MQKRWIWVVVMGLFALRGEAQSTDAVIWIDSLEVKSTSRINAGSPAPFHVLQRREIEMVPTVNIANVLNRIPGVFMQSGTLNTNRLSIRGVGNRTPFGTAKIRAYLGEIPLTNGVGETNLEDIDLSLLESVEVFKGPTASTYGAGLGGLVLLNPWKRSEYIIEDMIQEDDTIPKPKTPKPVTEIQYTTGSYGLHQASATTRFPRHNTRWMLVNGNFLQQNGYRDNSKYTRAGAAVMGEFIGRRLTWQYIAIPTYLKSFIPSSINRTDYEANPRKAAANWAAVRGYEETKKGLAGLSLQYEGRKDLRWTNAFTLNARESYESRPFNILDESSVQVGFRSVWHQPWISRLKLSNTRWGLEATSERYDWQTFATLQGKQGNQLSDDQEQRTYANLFTETQWILNHGWRIHAGVNANTTHYNRTDLFKSNGDFSGDRQFPLVVSPRLSIMKSGSGGKQMWYGTVSHGFSPPTLEETLAPSGAINPDIRAEQGWNWELGTRRLRTQGTVLNYELSVYRMYIKDLLVARRTAEDQFVGINAGKTLHQGLEALLHYDHFFRLFSREFYINASAAYTWSDYSFLDFTDGNATYDGNELTGTPTHQLNLETNLDLRKGFYVVLQATYTDAMPLRDDNTLYSDSYWLAHTKIGYKGRIGRPFELFVHVQNLFDVRYASMFQINAAAFGTAQPRYYYPGLPRHFLAGLKVSL